MGGKDKVLQVIVPNGPTELIVLDLDKYYGKAYTKIRIAFIKLDTLAEYSHA